MLRAPEFFQTAHAQQNSKISRPSLLRNLRLPVPPLLRHLLPECLQRLWEGNKEPSDNTSKAETTSQNQTQAKPMKINKLILISGALAGISIVNPFTTYAAPATQTPGAKPLITWTATGKQSKNVDVLFV